MLIETNIPVVLEVNTLADLRQLGKFMKDNELKVNKSKLARELHVDRRTISKYLDGFEKCTHRDKPSSMDAFYGTIRELLGSNTQVFHYKKSSLSIPSGQP